MDSEEIAKAVAEAIRKEASVDLANVPLERIIHQNLDSSAAGTFLQAFRKPTAWIAGIVGAMLEGEVSPYTVLKAFQGVALGAAIDALWVAIRPTHPNQSFPPAASLIRPEYLRDVSAAEQMSRFLESTTRKLRLPFGETPEERRMSAAVFRAARRNPKLLQMIA